MKYEQDYPHEEETTSLWKIVAALVLTVFCVMILAWFASAPTIQITTMGY